MALTSEFRDLTCNVTIMEKVFHDYPSQLDVKELSDVLCGAPVEEWYQRVYDMPHGRMSVFYVGMEVSVLRKKLLSTR